MTGRLKDLIIIDGANHAPQDLERTVSECHEALEVTECAAFSVRAGGREELVVIAAIRSARLEADALGLAIRAAVSTRHDLRVHDLVLVKAGGILRTPSGKVRRQACAAAYLAGTLERWTPP